MRILLDECLDRRFANSLSGHSVSTVSSQGWTGLTNGQLLSRAQHLFDAFITVDANIEFQQNVVAYDISIVVVKARSNRAGDFADFQAHRRAFVLNAQCES